MPALTLLAVASPSMIFATAIAALRSDSEVVLAADSLSLDASNPGAPVRGTMRKIRSTGRLFYAVAGLASSAGEFDAYESIAAAARGGGGGIAVADRAAARLEADFNRLTAEMRVNQPEQLRKYFDVMKPSFVIIAWEAGRPLCITRNSELNTSGPPYSITFSNTDYTTGLWCALTGKHEAAEAFARANFDSLFKGDLAVNARKLVELEIEEYPDMVGGPVDIVRLRGGKATWVARDQPTAPTKSRGPRRTVRRGHRRS